MEITFSEYIWIRQVYLFEEVSGAVTLKRRRPLKLSYEETSIKYVYSNYTQFVIGKKFVHLAICRDPIYKVVRKSHLPFRNGQTAQSTLSKVNKRLTSFIYFFFYLRENMFTTMTMLFSKVIIVSHIF